MSRVVRALLVGLLALGASGCPGDGALLGVCGDGTVDLLEECDDGNVDDGDGCSAACELEGGGGGMDNLTWIQDNVFTPTCATPCHFPGGPGPMPLTSEQVSYDNLVNVDSIQVALKRVLPFDSENSYLVHKIEGRPTIVGARMPRGGAMLPQEQIDAIIAWIDRGAPR